jgi:hypothetical protein
MENREISAATLRNYLKSIKLLCEELEVSLPWKRIARGMPRGRRYANDRAPTIDKLRCTMSIICYDFEKWTIISFASVAITLATGLVILVTN